MRLRNLRPPLERSRNILFRRQGKAGKLSTLMACLLFF